MGVPFSFDYGWRVAPDSILTRTRRMLRLAVRDRPGQRCPREAWKKSRPRKSGQRVINPTVARAAAKGSAASAARLKWGAG